MTAAINNIKRAKLIRAVKKLCVAVPDLQLKKGSKHCLKLVYPSVVYGRPTYPLSVNSPVLMFWVVDELIKWLTKNKICTKEKFLELLK